MLANKLRAATAAAASVEPVGIDFDGTNDYLSRSSDLVGNADGKTFTFSAWLYLAESGSWSIYSDEAFKFTVYGNSNQLIVVARNLAGANIANFEIISSGMFPLNTFLHILISIDLTNASNRYVYINDVNRTSDVTWITYTNDTIDFTNSNHVIGDRTTGGYRIKQRLAHVFLDYTYRDLSVEANRRLFITADGKPADGQASLSPILYLPMDDPSNPVRNDGTGGDFTLNGVVAQAGRGPNQYNSPASTFDGSADYLSRSSLTGISDGKQVTAAGSFLVSSPSVDFLHVFYIGTGSNRAQIRASGTAFYFEFRDASGNQVATVNATDAVLAFDKWIHFALSVDVTPGDNSKAHLLINGVATSATITVNNSNDFDLTGNVYRLATDSTTPSQAGNISDFWFDTTYIDLSTNNPFYDTETGKPKDLGVDGSEPTGSAPLIYLPLRADDAGSNKGTGGDFTVNPGPYTGARGPSEFWGESAEFNGSNQYLSKTNAASDTKTFSVAFAINTASTSGAVLSFRESGVASGMDIDLLTNDIRCTGRNTSDTQILRFETTGNILPSNTWTVFLVSIDLSDTGKRHVYVNGVSAAVTWTTYTNDTLELSQPLTTIARNIDSGNYVSGKIGFLWFNTEYIDFSQEANRLKFFDAFGYPVDLGEDGSLPTGNQPLIYMNNDFQLGTNLGSGGNFTPQNTPTDGGYVKG